MQKIYLSLDPPPSTASSDMNLWIHSHANVAGSCTGTYISAQHKKSVYEYANANTGSFPPLLRIKDIADGTIKLFLSDNEKGGGSIKAEVVANIELFKWYWDVLLGQSCPSGTKFWESNTKYYTRSPITPQMEAFIVVNFMNNY
jgi:hypothetical protein